MAVECLAFVLLTMQTFPEAEITSLLKLQLSAHSENVHEQQEVLSLISVIAVSGPALAHKDAGAVFGS